MTESITLARLSVDSKGVVAGVNQAGKALDTGAAKTQQFSKAATKSAGATGQLVGRMFDLKTAATAALSVFSVAGIAIILTSLARNVIANSEAFQKFSATLRDWIGVMFLGEDALDSLNRAMTRLGKEAGVTINTNFDEQVQKLRQLKFSLEAATNLWQTGSTRLIGLRIGLDATNQKLREMFEQFLAIGGTREQFERVFNLNVPLRVLSRSEAFQFLGLPTREQLEEALSEFFQARSIINQEVSKGLLDPRVAGKALDAMIEKLTAMGASARDLELALGGLVQVSERSLTTFQQQLVELSFVTQAFKSAQVQASLFDSAVRGFAQALTEAAIAGEFSVKKLVATVLTQLAQLMITWGTMAFALGILALTPWGRFLGSPGKFFASAAKFLAGAAVAVAASRAVSGGEGGGAEQSRGAVAGGAPVQQGSVGGPTIIINVQGSLMGTSREQLGREILKLTRQAAKDNA